MRIVRFTPSEKSGIGTDPHYGVLNDKDELLVLKGDPLYTGIVPTETKINLADVKVLAPVLPRSKVVAIGKNYADHAAEMNSALPDEPIIFLKPNTAVIGPDETIQWPRMADRIDFEGELAIVIGRICKDVQVGNGPEPTRVVYALTMPITRVIFVGPIPEPVDAPPAVGLEEVTNG